jgi:hypothetical protein
MPHAKPRRGREFSSRRAAENAEVGTMQHRLPAFFTSANEPGKCSWNHGLHRSHWVSVLRSVVVEDRGVRNDKDYKKIRT